MRQAIRFVAEGSQCRRTAFASTAKIPIKLPYRNFNASAARLRVDDYSRHPKDRVEPPHDPKFDRPMMEWWKQSEARQNIEVHDDSWSNVFNVNIMPEEVRFPEPHYTPTQKLLHNDIVQRINHQITERTHDRLFAVIHVAGRQYKVCEEDMISIPGTFHVEFGQKIYLQKLLGVGCADFSLFGRPMLDRNLVRVHATVIEKTLAATQTFFYFVRKIHSRQYRYLRIPQTVLRINQIEFTRRLDEDRPVDLMPQSAELSTSFANDGGKLTNFEMPDRPWFPLFR